MGPHHSPAAIETTSVVKAIPRRRFRYKIDVIFDVGRGRKWFVVPHHGIANAVRYPNRIPIVTMPMEGSAIVAANASPGPSSGTANSMAGTMATEMSKSRRWLIQSDTMAVE
jgi:hypothetical protein